MPHGEHRTRCLHCLNYYNSGDCITFTCDKCEQAGHAGCFTECPACLYEAQERRARVAATDKPCGATFEPLNGEYVSPCDLLAGHGGNHQGYVLGSRCHWEQGRTSEYDEWDAKLDAIEQELEGRRAETFQA